MRKRDITLMLVPVVVCAGCVIAGQDTSNPETQEKAVDYGTKILQAVASVTGQGWAAPIIGAVGATLLGALNAHHGLRNVAVGSAKLVAKPFIKKPAA